MNIIRQILVLIILVWGANISAQEYLFDAQNITSENGLSSLMTSAIYKDKEGFLWISTNYGINKYDGREFQQYTSEKNGLFSDQYVRKIEEDSIGNLWLFHYYPLRIDTIIAAIDIFDPIRQEATPFDDYFGNNRPFNASESTIIKTKDPKKRTWLASKNGQIFLYENNRFKKIFDQKGTLFTRLTIDEEDNIWLNSYTELICINQQGVVLESFEFPSYITDLWIEDGNIWLSSTSYGIAPVVTSVWFKDKNSTDFEPFYFGKDKKTATIGKRVVKTANDFWYVEKDNRFYLFNSKGEELMDFHSLLNKGTECGFVDYIEIDNTIWFTTPIGIIKTMVKENPFYLIHERTTLSDCRQITEDELGNIYFLNSYLYVWNAENKTVKRLSEIRSHVGLTYLDSTVFAGYYSQTGIGYELDLRTNKETFFLDTQHYQLETLSPTNEPGIYYMGQVKGLGYLDGVLKKYRPFYGYNGFDELREVNVAHFHKNERGTWIATEIGLFLMDEKDQIVQHFDINSGDLPFNYIRHICEDEEGIFWLSTKGGGIIKWDPEGKEATRQLTMVDGLSNNYTYAIYEDDFKHLWISSDKGLMCMNRQNYEVKTYLVKDGLLHNEFNKNSHYKGKNGVLYFGGLGGVIAFHPKDLIQEDGKDIPLKFTKFFLLEKNKENVTDRTELLYESDVIVIEPEDKFFEVHFRLLDFEPSEEHHYAYQIEGYSEHWNQIDENYIRITNLPYGEYVIKVRGQNRKKGWSGETLELKIRVSKPFYLTLWFGIGLLIAVVIAFFMILHWREQKAKKDHQRLEKEVKERTKTIEEQAKKMEVLNKVKTRFFANITHEFRTPLTLIIGPLEQVVEEDLPADVQHRLGGVLKNGKHLLTLINQMLDLSKIESGQMNLAVSRGDIIAYTKELTKRFQALAEEKEQRLTFISNKDYWETSFDKNKWDKIVYNLLSNALKFTPSGKAIQLSLVRVLKEDQEFIRLDVKDTGVGIEQKYLDQIFNRFYQIDYSATREQEGTGIGLALVKELVGLQGGTISVLSELHKGTSFEIHLPVLDLKTETPLVIDLNDRVLAPMVVSDQPVKDDVRLEGQEDKLDLLIIEDNAEMRAYIRSCVDESKYHIIEANNGEKGILKALKIVPDLIISDVMMPKKDGFEVVQAVRNNISTSHIPFIFLTARAALESRLQGLKGGADAYLTKPFSPKELTIRIQKLIESRQLLQQRYQYRSDELPVEIIEQKEDPFIVELRTYILDHIDAANLSGDTIGKHFLISRVHLHRKLKALTNQPISDFVRSVRLNRSMELIKEGNLNISEIAHQTGFSSVSHFSRSFKKAYGKAPSKM